MPIEEVKTTDTGDTANVPEDAPLQENAGEATQAVNDMPAGPTSIQEVAAQPVVPSDIGNLPQPVTVDTQEAADTKNPPQKVTDIGGPLQKVTEDTQKVTETLLTDELNLEMGILQQEVGGRPNEQEIPAEGEGLFDELPVAWNEENDGKKEPGDVPGSLWELKKEIGKAREGKLYTAVLIARELKNGRSNPMAKGRLRRYASKALNTSAWEATSDINKLAGSTVGLANSIDKNGALKPLWQGATLISNFVTMVTTSRDLFLKFKNFRGGSLTDKLFKAVGICGDIAMLLSKLCNMAKIIAGYFGGVKKVPVLKDVMKWLILALNMGNQLASITTASRAVHTARQKHKELKEKETADWEKVQPIIKKNRPKEEIPEKEPAETEDPEADKNEPSNNTEAKDTGSAGKQERQKPAGAVLKNPKVEQVEALLNDDNVNLSEEEKDVLIRYLAVTKRKDKVERSLLATSAGLVSSVSGLCSSLFTSAVYGASYSEKAEPYITGIGTMGMNLLTTSGAFLSVGTKRISRQEEKGDNRTKEIGDRLWEKLGMLGANEYGLKGIEDSIENGNISEEGNVHNVLKMYDDTDKLFTDTGVPYDKLYKAHDEETFKKMLVAGI